MPKFAANIGLLWPDRPLTNRVHAAADAGFSAVECHWPYDTNTKELTMTLQETGLEMLCLNTSPGDLAAGEFGLCALPHRKEDARTSIDQAIEYATSINCKNIHVMTGVTNPGQYNEQQILDTFQQNLTYATEQAAITNIQILIEPINQIDRPGYALHSIPQALSLIEQNPKLKLMFDCYHVQRSGENLMQQLSNVWPHIGHIQIASAPDRHEPDHGEIDFLALYTFLDNQNYQGMIGAEYIPRTTTDAGLGWLTTAQTLT